MRNLKIVAVLVAAVTIAAGCGDDNTSAEEAGSADATGAISSDDGSAGGDDSESVDSSDEGQSDSDSDSSGGARAVVVVGDRTFEMFPVEPSPLCFLGTDGSMTVNAASTDYDISNLEAPTGATVYMLIQPNEWQPPAEGDTGFVLTPTITVSDLDTGENFVAEVDHYPGFVGPEDSAVLESDLGDGGAEGTARFVEGSQATSQQTPITYEGTFEVDCGN